MINHNRFYVEFSYFLDKIIKISILKTENNEDIFIDLGIVYPSIEIESSSFEKSLEKVEKELKEYLKILSLKGVEGVDLDTFLKNPTLFSNYLMIAIDESEVSKVLEKVFDAKNLFIMYVYNKKIHKLKQFLNLFNEQNLFLKNGYIVDLLPKISPIKYENTTNFRQKLILLKQNSL